MADNYFDFVGQNAGEEKKEASQETQAMANVTVRADADCFLLCDGEYLDVQLEAGKLTKIQVPIGQHLMEFIYTEDANIKVEKVVDFPEAGKNYLVLVQDLKAAVDNVAAEAKAKEETKSKAEEEAKRKAEEESRRKAEEEAKNKAEEEAKRKAEVEAKRKAEEARYRKFTIVKDCFAMGKYDKDIPYGFQFNALDFEKIRIRRHLLLPAKEYRCELIFVGEEGNFDWYGSGRWHFNPFTLEFDNGETHIESSPESNEEWIVFKNPFHVESEWDDDDVNVFLGGGIDGRPIDERYFDWGLQDYDLISEKVPSELVCMPTILKFIRDNVEYIPVYKGF